MLDKRGETQKQRKTMTAPYTLPWPVMTRAAVLPVRSRPVAVRLMVTASALFTLVNEEHR